MPPHWLGFSIIVAALLVVDMFALQRPGRPASIRVAWLWTLFLALLAGGYALWIAATTGRQPAIEFATGYLIESSLSVDNLFVFLLMFRALRLDAAQQRRVLLWGVLGAIVLRALHASKYEFLHKMLDFPPREELNPPKPGCDPIIGQAISQIPDCTR